MPTFDANLAHTGLDRLQNIEQYLTLISSDAVIGPAASGDTTGVTDTASLQAAINAAGAANAELVLPAGSYTVTNLTAPAGNGSVRIVGAGPGKTTIQAASGATGVLLDLTFSPTQAEVAVENLSLNCTNATTMTALRTSGINRLRIRDCNFRYGAIGWQHTMVSGTGPFYMFGCNFQNHNSKAIYLTGSSGLGGVGTIEDVLIQVTDGTTTLTQGVLVDWWTTGVTFNNVQVLGNVAGNNFIHNGIVYNTAAPTGAQGAFLLLFSCVTDQMDTGNGLDLTNARGIWSTGNFWSVYSGASGTYGVNINGGKEQFYVNDWISGSGMNFTNAPDKITIGSGNRYPQTQGGASLNLPAANPPTNLIVSSDAFFYGQMTNRVGTLETATRHNFNWTRAGSYV